MSTAVARACAESVERQDDDGVVDVVWHGGEPTTTPIAHFRSLLAPFEPLRRMGRITHGIQTNATLLNDSWCDLLIEYDFQVGVSIDGPREANASRVDRAGRDTWDRTMRGIELLRSRLIPFTVICVVTPDTVRLPDLLLDFFTTLGCDSVGFNIEEQEGTDRRPVAEYDAYQFWHQLTTRRVGGLSLPIRELDRVAGFISPPSGRHHDRAPMIDPIPTVAYNGQTVLLSPELSGVLAPPYGHFLAGNVLTSSLSAMISRRAELNYVNEFEQAIRECANECEFFGFCGGAQAANRYFEYGSFAVRETSYCRNTKQTLLLAVANVLAR